MSTFCHAIEWFFYGFILGCIADPAWRLLTKIVEEVKLARDEWHGGSK